MVRGASAALATFALALVLAGPAASGTRQQTTQKILSDLADNGRLDRRYTPTQIYRALDSLETYERERREKKPQPPRRPPSNRQFPPTLGQLPFSGLDLALFGAVGRATAPDRSEPRPPRAREAPGRAGLVVPPAA